MAKCEFECPLKENVRIGEKCPAAGMRDRTDALNYCRQVVKGRNDERLREVTQSNFQRPGIRVMINGSGDPLNLDPRMATHQTRHTIKFGIEDSE